jgi:hypothetical protein
MMVAYWRPLLFQLRRLIKLPSTKTGNNCYENRSTSESEQSTNKKGNTSDMTDAAYSLQTSPSSGHLLPSVAKSKLIGCFEKLAASVRQVSVRLRRRTFGPTAGSASSILPVYENGKVINRLSILRNQVASANGDASLLGIALLVSLLEVGCSTDSDPNETGRESKHQELSSSDDDDANSKPSPAKRRHLSESTFNAQSNGNSNEAVPSVSPDNLRFWWDWLETLIGTGIEGVRRAPDAISQSDILIAELLQLRITMIRAPDELDNASRFVEEFFDDPLDIGYGADENFANRICGIRGALRYLSARESLLRRLLRAMNSYAWDECERKEIQPQYMEDNSDMDDTSGAETEFADESAFFEPKYKRNDQEEFAGERIKRRRTRLRSRNRVIDDWLSDEEGDDAFADLEEFIVA